MKDILQYKNGLNNLELGKMSAREQDIFFYILFLLSKNKLAPLEIKFSELKKRIDGQYTNNKQLGNTIRKMVKKFQSTVQEYQIEEGKYCIFNVLEDTTVDVKNGIITTSLKKAFRELLEIEEKSKCYMSIDLKEMCNLKSSYLKILYRYLKQWDNVGKATIKIQDFKKILDIPEAYRFYDIDRRILIPAIEEFKDIFKGFSIEKNNSNTKGKKIDEITFTWQRVVKKKTKKQEDREQEKNITAAKKIFNKEVAVEKTIKAEKEIANLKAEERLAEIVKTNLSNNVAEEPIIEVTSDKYMEIYNDYLKANNIEHSVYVKKAFDIINKNKVRIKENKKAF
ncbi:Protein involved in initiation of plasmid replication [Cetobacterium ceti]|uniref:Protein involved in initiation of plasmid replication n=1 Tax=Cetobacterium ceti TaxID=180163 RepID=A0A1T4Q6K2_9FUSO|nr:replication initiation protein [Cetobacterium ceti]SJZ99329.1 Protein involved in initiation of plasmid replication [Cetobacterium ceti]